MLEGGRMCITRILTMEVVDIMYLYDKCTCVVDNKYWGLIIHSLHMLG